MAALPGSSAGKLTLNCCSGQVPGCYGLTDRVRRVGDDGCGRRPYGGRGDYIAAAAGGGAHCGPHAHAVRVVGPEVSGAVVRHGRVPLDEVSVGNGVRRLYLPA